MYKKITKKHIKQLREEWCRLISSDGPVTPPLTVLYECAEKYLAPRGYPTWCTKLSLFWMLESEFKVDLTSNKVWEEYVQSGKVL